MQYICTTRELTLKIEPDDCPNWWVDSSYLVHQDMPSHSGMAQHTRRTANRN